MHDRPSTRSRSRSIRRPVSPLWTLVAVLSAGVVMAQPGSFGSDSPDRRTYVPEPEIPRPGGYPAITMPSRTQALSFVTAGVVKAVHVEESDYVTADQVLISLDDDIQRANVEAQRERVTDRSEIEAAIKRRELAEAEFDSIKEMDRQGAAAKGEIRRREIEVALRQIDERAAISEAKEAAFLLEREEARLADMTLASAADGIVIRIESRKGDAVDALQPVIHVVSIDPLWMDVAVPVQLGLLIQPDEIAIVNWRDVPSQTPLEGRVLYKSPVADAASNSIVVRLEIDNPEQIPSGMHALVDFPEANQSYRRLNP